MPPRSAGILLYRNPSEVLEVLLVHPGGPANARRDAGAWSVPKGEYDTGEEPLAAAKREFLEELGQAVPAGNFLPLQPVKQKSGKIVTAWAVEGDLDITTIKSNFVSVEWPYKSGRRIEVPEVDRAEWFAIEAAKVKIIAAQVGLLEELSGLLR